MIVKMWLTEEDQKILQFVEDFGSITINQAQKMYYPQLKGYEMARKHLTKLCGYDKLLVSEDPSCRRNVYYFNKKPSYHSILVMEYYTELIKNGAVIKYFKREQPWLNRNYMSDAYCCYTIKNKVYFDILEVVRSRGSFFEPKKYEDIFASGEAQTLNNNLFKQLGGRTEWSKFPRIVVIDQVKHTKKLAVNESIVVTQLDFKLTDFAKELLM